MFNLTSIVLLVILVLEALLIIIGNTFAIFVFWTQKLYHKRTCFLLINLAVADLLVGITEPIVIATEKIPEISMHTIMNATGKDITRLKSGKSPSSAIQLLASSTSVFFLALISLERAFAVIRPLRHHVMSNRVYIYSMVIVWAIGLFVATLSVLSSFYRMLGGVLNGVVHSCLFISLLVICASYLKIRTRLQYVPPEIDDHNRQSAGHNLRLSSTFFIAIAVSLVLWLPAFVVYTTKAFCLVGCIPPRVVWFVNVLHLGNSLVNPFVYSFRMPIFKDALKKLSCKRQQINQIDMSPVQTC